MSHIKQIRELAKKNFAEHKIYRFSDGLITAVRLGCQGPFRFLRCQKPGTWIYGFDVIFYPGRVTIDGDIGHLTLQRTEDMTEWLRETVTREKIDFQYVAEKAPQCIQTRQWDCDAALAEFRSFYEDNLGVEFNTCEMPQERYEELCELCSQQDTWMDSVVPFYVEHGCYEFDGKTWSPEFLWCVFGLQKFMELYDG